jgi:hypothetical protein
VYRTSLLGSFGLSAQGTYRTREEKQDFNTFFSVPFRVWLVICIANPPNQPIRRML